MRFINQAFVSSALLAVAHGQAVILAAHGVRGSGVSRGLQVDPRGRDANIINDNEITTNIVNQCGRTVLGGNIDVGATTEDALADGNITQAVAGGRIAVFIQQGNEKGAGPFTCDLDDTNNSRGVSGQTKLQTKENQPNEHGVIGIRIQMPNDLKCVGSSPGNVCTIRCRNQNDFGGCFAFQQQDTQPQTNDPSSITTAQDLDAILKQVQQNIQDLPAALEAIANASDDPNDQGTAIINAIQSSDRSTLPQ
ncbi:GEgh16 protein [Astrocystis sublimbata]|nr:GEgh16 protein [Astrocystis sublimbata]